MSSFLTGEFVTFRHRVLGDLNRERRKWPFPNSHFLNTIEDRHGILRGWLNTLTPEGCTILAMLMISSACHTGPPSVQQGSTLTTTTPSLTCPLQPTLQSCWLCAMWPIVHMCHSHMPLLFNPSVLDEAGNLLALKLVAKMGTRNWVVFVFVCS
jgi:hypothetical protein